VLEDLGKRLGLPADVVKQATPVVTGLVVAGSAGCSSSLAAQTRSPACSRALAIASAATWMRLSRLLTRPRAQTR